MAVKKIWKFHRPSNPRLVQTLCEAFQLPPMVSGILIRRGYTSIEAVQKFLEPALSDLTDPYLMKGMSPAVALLKSAILAQKRIVILGDYDVDGITATAMMMLFLKECGCHNLDYFIPNRFAHGYGLTPASVQVLLTMKPDLILTVDNGITAHEEVAFLHKQGIETLITDHHLTNGHQLPQGIVINPNQPGCTYPFKGISGCGVALKLLMALRKEFRETGFWSQQKPEPNLKTFLDLVAMGTVADVVPMKDENRLLVYHGLKMMNTQPRTGIQALCHLKNVNSINAQTLGFQFGPLLNAAGRMENASVGVALLLATTLHEAQKVARQLHQANQERRLTESHMMELATEQAKQLQHQHGLVVHSSKFHEGISGIVAARLVERYHKPALVCAKNGNHYKCSARSIPELHLRETLDQCSEFLEKFGGHAGAAGCSVPEQQFEAFVKAFENLCKNALTPLPQPIVMLEAELQIETIDWELLKQLERLQPFGSTHPIPLFSLATPQVPFDTFKDKHVKWSFQDKEILGWNLAPSFQKAVPQRLAVQLGINEFRGQKKIQLLIQDHQ